MRGLFNVMFNWADITSIVLSREQEWIVKFQRHFFLPFYFTQKIDLADNNYKMKKTRHKGRGDPLATPTLSLQQHNKICTFFVSQIPPYTD